MRYRTHGTRLAALLLVAIMALSVFAMPVAATSAIEESSDIEINTDDFNGEDFDVEDETFNISLSGTPEYDAGEQVVIGLNDDEVDEGDLNIESAEVIERDGIDVEAEPVNGPIFSTTADTIVVTFNEEITESEADIEIQYDLKVDSDLEEDPAAYTGEKILEVVSDDNDGEDPITVDEEVATLEVHPGEPHSLTLEDGDPVPSTFLFEQDGETFDVGVEDAQGNLIDEANVGQDLNEFDIYSDTPEINVSADLLTSGDGTPFETADGDDGATNISLDEGSQSPDLATFTIDNGSSGGDVLEELIIGDDLEISVQPADDESEFDHLNNDQEDIVIEPDVINFSAESEEITADEGDDGITLTHRLEDDSENTQPVDNISINLDSDRADLNGITLSLDGEEIVSETDETATVNVEESELELEFSATNNDIDQDVQATVVEGSTEGDTGNIDVLSAEPDVLAFDQDDDHSVVIEDASVDVQVEDKYGNIIDDRDFGETHVQISYETENLGDRMSDTFEITLDGAGGAGSKEVEFIEGDDPTGAEIQVAAGSGFDIEAKQTDPAPSTESIEVETLNDVTIYPEVVVSQGTQHVNAGEEQFEAFTVEFQAGGEVLDEGDDNVDSVPVSATFNDQGVQDGIEIDGDIVANGSAQLSSIESNSFTVDYELRSAGIHNITFDATLDDSDTSEADTDDITVDALAFDESESSISIGNDFFGVIEDDNTTQTVTFELRDEFGNYPAYTDNDNLDDASEVNFEIEGEDFADGGNLIGTDFDITNVEDANPDETLEIDPTDISISETDLGEVDAKVLDDNGDVVEANAVELTHEAYDLSTGYQRVSLPQPAEVLTQDVNGLSTWNSTQESYESGDIELPEGEVSSSTHQLHVGIQAHGTSDDARMGFDFDTESRTSGGPESLEDGWNFVSTNFDLAEQASGGYELEKDLLSVTEIEKDGSSQEFVMDGGLNKLLDASDKDSDSTGDLSDAINAGDNDDGEFGTYWVYVNETAGDEYDRQIIKPGYDEDNRFD